MIRQFPFKIFFRFGVVGGLSFLLDAGLLTLLTNVYGWSPVVGQVVAFSVTILFSWALNRRFTFRVQSQDQIFREFRRYLAVYGLGMVIHWLVYLPTLYLHAVFYEYPALALVPATAASMFFNFFGAKNFAFRGR